MTFASYPLRRRRRGFRGGFQTHAIAALLLAALAVVALLTLRAHYAVTSHRAMAEEVLRDYAALVGDEALRRIAVQVGLYGYREAFRALREAAASSAPEEVADLHEASEDRSFELIARAFLYQRATRRLSSSESREEVDAWLVSELDRLEPAEEAEFRILHAEIDGEPVSVVAGALEVGELEVGVGTLVGFEVDREAVSRWCAEALEAPLLPPTLAHGELDNRALVLQVLDAQGRVLCAQGEPTASAVLAERTFPEDYRSVLDGLRVAAGIRSDAASRLVIGGLPRSELPVLLTLLGLIFGLLAAAAVLLRRERELVRLRSEFVSRVSHELRTPLAQIRMFTETLRLGRVRNDDERRRSLEIMDRESRRLSALVENVLQFSRAERGSVQLAPRRLSVARLLRRLAGELDVIAQPAGVTLVVDAPDSLEVEADEDALRQIVINLVDNAIKYGPREQRVGLGAALVPSQGAANGTVRLWVEDEGPGVPAAERERVWQPFLRVESARHSAAGTGIGLAVVRELVQQHGGGCWLEAREPTGTRVVVELPVHSGEGSDSELGEGSQQEGAS